MSITNLNPSLSLVLCLVLSFMNVVYVLCSVQSFLLYPLSGFILVLSLLSGFTYDYVLLINDHTLTKKVTI